MKAAQVHALYDLNCLLGPWPEGGPTLLHTADLLAAMDRLGITRALVRHTLGWHYHAPDGNALLQVEIGGCERLDPCWTALPPITGEQGGMQEWLASLAAHNVRAICLYPAAHGYPLAAWQCDALLAPLAERRYVLLLELPETNWTEVQWVLQAYPGLRLVLLNTGYRVLRPLYALLDRHPNLFLDISFLINFRGIEDVCSRFGVDRLLLGTGQPRHDGAGVLTALRYAALSPEQMEAICVLNAQRLLGEVQP